MPQLLHAFFIYHKLLQDSLIFITKTVKFCVLRVHQLHTEAAWCAISQLVREEEARVLQCVLIVLGDGLNDHFLARQMHIGKRANQGPSSNSCLLIALLAVNLPEELG